MIKKIKTKKLKITPGDGDVSDVFNQMLSGDGTSIKIAYPRYLQLRDLCTQFMKIIDILEGSNLLLSYPQVRAELAAFVQDSKTELADLWVTNLDRFHPEFDQVPADVRAEFIAAYEKCKQANVVRKIVLACDNLIPYKNYFADVNKLNHTFIEQMPGVEWRPFPFSSLNYKDLFAQNPSDNAKRLMMITLNKCFAYSKRLFEELQMPDIDINVVITSIMGSMDQIKNIPELSRCGAAFDRIKKSVELLRERFGDYYRAYAVTKNSTIIMEHFVLDVSQNTDADPNTIRQFKVIVDYYRKIAKYQSSSPQVKILFDKVEQSFRKLTTGTENLDNLHVPAEDVQATVDLAPNKPLDEK